MAELPAQLDAVLRRVLSSYLDASHAEAAVRLWTPVEGAGNASALAGLSRFCRSVGERFDLRGREAELHLRIVRGMQEQARQSPERSPPGTPALERVSSSADVVRRCVLALEKRVAQADPQAHTPARWRQQLLKHSQALPAASLRCLSDWLDGGAVLMGDWPARGAGTTLLHAAYVSAAECLGPVKADACLSALVRQCEADPDPALRSIRRYL